jgi:hypothetical protein
VCPEVLVGELQLLTNSVKLAHYLRSCYMKAFVFSYEQAL